MKTPGKGRGDHQFPLYMVVDAQLDTISSGGEGTILHLRKASSNYSWWFP